MLRFPQRGPHLCGYFFGLGRLGFVPWSASTPSCSAYARTARRTMSERLSRSNCSSASRIARSSGGNLTQTVVVRSTMGWKTLYYQIFHGQAYCAEANTTRPCRTSCRRCLTPEPSRCADGWRFPILQAASACFQHLIMARTLVRRYLVASNCKSDLEGSDVARSKTPEFASRQQPMREAAKLERLARHSVEGQAHRG